MSMRTVKEERPATVYTRPIYDCDVCGKKDIGNRQCCICGRHACSTMSDLSKPPCSTTHSNENEYTDYPDRICAICTRTGNKYLKKMARAKDRYEDFVDQQQAEWKEASLKETP